jgi:hypothetical protein
MKSEATAITTTTATATTTATETTTETTTELVDIQTISVDKNLPKNERIIEFVRQIKDPCHYRIGNITITAIFPENAPTLEDCLRRLMS